MSTKEFFIRVDANPQIGIGHFMRCIALAQQSKKQGYKVTFISACENISLRNKIIDEGFQLVSIKKPYPDPVDLETTLGLINNSLSNNTWVVLDGYHFDMHYQQSIKNNGNRLLVIDDTAHLNYYVADIILNQNIIAGELNYSCEPDIKFLLGTDYVLLRDEFLSYKNWNRATPKVAKKILVTMGGGDSGNVSLKVLCALDKVNINGLEIKVVIGANYPHLNTLNKVAKDSKHKVELLQNVSSMPDLIVWADMAISAAGSTCWELAYFGLPAILIIISANQMMNLKFLEKYGAATFVRNRMNISTNMISGKIHQLIMDKELRNTMSHTGKLLIDGSGSERVVNIFQT
jgi:UDP-2,4-diacetamido-2,4,6-trideoxy-beta-L-altropyranose hydrolase